MLISYFCDLKSERYFMRIDKFLWTVRYYKTRSQATESINKGHVSVGNQKVKPSREVFVGDIITVRKDQINYTLEVLDIPENRIGAKLVDLYRKDTTDKEQFEKLELLKYSQDYYRQKGSGRPTKKDRRDITDFMDN